MGINGNGKKLSRGEIKALRVAIIVGMHKAGCTSPTLLAEAAKCSAALVIQTLIRHGLHKPRRTLRDHLDDMSAELVEKVKVLSANL